MHIFAEMRPGMSGQGSGWYIRTRLFKTFFSRPYLSKSQEPLKNLKIRYSSCFFRKSDIIHSNVNKAPRAALFSESARSAAKTSIRDNRTAARGKPRKSDRCKSPVRYPEQFNSIRFIPFKGGMPERRAHLTGVM